MKHALMFCLLAVNFFAQPNQGTPKNTGRTAQDSAKAAPPASKDNRIAATNQETSDSRPPKWYTALQKSDWWLVLIAAGTGFVIAIQAGEMRRATSVMQGQMTVMQRQVDLMFGQLRAMHEQITEMSAQTGLLQQYVADTRTIAVAAKGSADATRDSVEAFISKERARLRIVAKNFDADSPQTMSVKYSVQFYGNVEAFILQSAAYAVITNSKTPNINDELAKIFRMDVPEVIGPATKIDKERVSYAYSNDPRDFRLIDAIDEAKMFVHFYAFIRYRTLDRERETKICLTWDVDLAINKMLLFGSKADHWEKSGKPDANLET